MSQLPPPEQVCITAALTLRASVRAHPRPKVACGINLDGWRFTIRGAPCKPTLDTSFDGPADLHFAFPKVRRAYTTLRDLRRERGLEAGVWPLDVQARWAAEEPDVDHSIDTINHAFTDLKKRGHVRSDRARGLLLQEQPQLFEAEPKPAKRPTAAELLREARRESRINPRVWVPGAWSGGSFLVLDADSGRRQTVETIDTDCLGSIRLITAAGETREVPAVRGELLGVDGRIATVRLTGGEQVRTHVLGDWHLAGLAGRDEAAA